MEIYLASQSPRRRELLAQLGVVFSVLDADVPEIPYPEEPPEQYVRRVARDKALAGWRMVDGERQGHARVVASDTEVVLDGRIFGKPRDAADAKEMLHALSGRTHEVMSAVWVISPEQELGDVCISRVRFAPLTEAAIAAYVASGESFGKAGAYAIQGRGASLIQYLEGSYSGVMGLPLFETAGLLRRVGVPV